MAAAGEGSSAPAFVGYGGGGGGKFDKRAFRRSRATPYDRPPTARRSSNWISKLVVDPVSKLITASAQRFFSSVFRKRLPPPPPPPPLLPPPEANVRLSDKLEYPVLPKQDEELQIAVADSRNFTDEDNSGISELEQLLKQKKFTRYEIDRLTELLQSKAVGSTVANDVRGTEPSLSEPVHQQALKDSLKENKRERDRSHGVIPAPGIRASDIVEDITSPQELAKAYMGRQPLKELPSTSSFRGKVTQDGSLLSTLPSSSNSRVLSLATNTNGRINIQENGFTTPRSRGRSAIYNMARTPYLRLHPPPSGKGTGSNGNVLASPTLRKQDGGLGWKEPARKRSSSVLDDDFGSVGPIRRIRQKHGLVSRNTALSLGGKDVSAGVQQPLPLNHKHSFMDDWNYRGSEPANFNDSNTPSTSYSHIPHKSSETAARILQNLEKMTPREKSAGPKLVAGESSPFKLTKDMLSGQALKSLESSDSLKLLHGNQDVEKLKDSFHLSSAGVHDFSFQKQEREEEDSRKSHLQFERALSVNGETSVSAENRLSSLASASPTVSVFPLAPKKHAFRISAREDFFDLDEDTHSNGLTTESSLEERVSNKALRAESAAASAGKLISDKTSALFETRREVKEPETVTNNASAVHLSSPAIEKPKDVENSLASFSEVSSPPLSSWMQPKPLSSIRSDGPTSFSPQVPGSGEQKDISEEDVRAKEKPETKNSVEVSSNIFSSMSSSSLSIPSKINNGPLSLSPSESLLSPSGIAAASTTAFVSTTVAVPLSATSSNLASPASHTSAPLMSFEKASSAPDAETSVIKSEVDKGNVVPAAFTPPAGSISGTSASVGGSLFGLGSHNDFSSKPQSQDTSSEAMLNRQSSEVGSGAVSVSPSMPFQFGASTSVSSGSSAFVSSSPNTALFNSSAPATNLFGFGSSFGGSSSTLQPELKSFSTGSGSSSGIMSSSSTVPTVSSGVDAVSSSSGSYPIISSFGLGSSGTSPVINTVTSSSSASFGTFSSFASSSSTTSSSALPFSASSSSFGTSAAGTGGATFSTSEFSWQTPKSPSFSNTFGSSPSTGFAFGASSTSGASTSTAPGSVFAFGASSTSAASSAAAGPVFAFGASTPTPGSLSSFSTSSSTSLFPTQSVFTNSPSTFATTGNNGRMNTEDSMAEDPMQSSPGSGLPGFTQLSFGGAPGFTQTSFGSAPGFTQQSFGAAPGFTQPPFGAAPGFTPQPVPSPAAGFQFNSATPPSASPFQFGAPQIQGAMQNNPQGSGSFDFKAGGNFSMGSGEDKSTRRRINVSKNRHRKK